MAKKSSTSAAAAKSKSARGTPARPAKTGPATGRAKPAVKAAPRALAQKDKKPSPAPLKSVQSSSKSEGGAKSKPAAPQVQANGLGSLKRGPGTIAVDKKTRSPDTTPAPIDSAIKIARPRVKRPAIELPANYKPSDREPFMNELQREYFRRKLLAWKDDINRETQETLSVLNQESQQHADLADRASSETDRALELRARDRQRKLIAKIDAALARIDDGSYGFCEDTGEPIGLKRLDARPIATLSIEAQERHERRERVYRDE